MSVSNISTSYLKIKWRFSENGFNTYASENMLLGDLALLQNGTVQTLKMFNGTLLEDYIPPDGWDLSEIITTDDKGIIIDYPERTRDRRIHRFYYAVLRKCCGTQASDCLATTSTITVSQNTNTVNAPTTDHNYNNCLVTVNGFPQEIGATQPLLSFNNGVLIFNTEYEVFIDDVIVFRKFCGMSIDFSIIQSDTNQFQLPTGFETPFLITVNGFPQEINPNLHIQSIINGLITFNTEYTLYSGDIIVFRNV